MSTILLVDDQSGSHSFAAKVLRDDGHKVVEVHHPLDAVKLMRDSTLERDEIDLVITDLEMRHMNGVLLLEAFRSFGVQVPFILCTARSFQEAKRLKNLGFHAVLEKPPGLVRLTVSVRSALLATVRS